MRFVGPLLAPHPPCIYVAYVSIRLVSYLRGRGRGRFMLGLVSVGLVRVGLVSVGLVSVGLVSVGLVSIGLVSAGLVSFARAL
jgi:hypothetical protein